MIRPQRSEDAVTLAASSTTTVIRETGPAERDRVFSFRLDADTDASALLTLTERGKFGSTRIVKIAIGPRGAGRIRVHGSVEAIVALDAIGANTFHYTMLEVGSVEPAPPLDAMETRTGGIAVAGPWLDVLDGWCPAERYTLGIATAGAIDFRFIDGAGAVFAQWTVNGSVQPILHPPRVKLQARQPSPAIVTGFVAAWR